MNRKLYGILPASLPHSAFKMHRGKRSTKEAFDYYLVGSEVVSAA